MPAAAASASSGVPGRHPGVVITRSVPAGSSGAGIQFDRDAEAGQLVRDPAVGLVVAAVDGRDQRATGGEQPGDRRAGDAEPVDEHP